MRIVHVVTLVDDRNSYGGPLTVAVNQCRELRRRGHDAVIAAGWSGDGKPPREIEGVPAHLFQVMNVLPGTRFSGLVSPGLLRWVRAMRSSIDVAHVHLARDLIPLSVARVLRRTDVPYVTQTHGMIAPDGRFAARFLDGLVARPVLHAARARFVLTDAERTALGAVCGGKAPLTELPNGVTVPAIPEAHHRGGTLDVLFMARLHPRKRVLDFARAAEVILDNRKDATFSVVGPDAGDLAALTRFINDRPTLAGRLRYEGALPHDQALIRLAKADLYVLPSVDEPFPMSLLEALALGRPAICTNQCGLSRLLAENQAAHVIEATPDALARAIQTLLAQPILRQSLSDTGRRTVADRFSMRRVGDDVLKVYCGSDPDL